MLNLQEYANAIWRMTLLVPLVVLCIASICVQSAYAQTEQPSSGGSAEEVPVDSGRVEELIKTLESDTARAELITELKLLTETQAEEEDPGAELADAVKLDEQAQVWKQQYKRFLDRHGLNASLVGYIAVSVGLLIVTLVLLIAYGRGVRFVYRKLTPLISRFYLSPRRMSFYRSVMATSGYVIIVMVALAALFELWGLNVDDWLSENAQLLILQAVISVVTIFALGACIIELSNAAVEYLFRRKLSAQQARMNTLLPIVRNLLLLTLFTLFGLTLLSQLGLNVMPLLAGAGVVGFAVGFGAQTLIKDMLVGFIVIIEDLIQVGDVATLGGKSGLVEKITIRKVQLRDLDGTVFTVPFSEISIVANLTKNFSYYLLDLRVAFRENTDEVVAMLKEIDGKMRQEEAYRDLMLEPIEVLGVDRFTESAVMIKARIKTPPLQQWTIGREFNRRLKQTFDAADVQMPFPHRTLYFGEDKSGEAPPARLDIVAAPPAAGIKDGSG